MTMLTGFLSAVFWGMLVLSLLVLVHEGGHFLAARAFGVRVTEFFLGLPCRWRISRSSKRFGTEFGVTPFLLGGYNRICGMEGTPDELLPHALAIVQRTGRVEVKALSEELGIDEERGYHLMASLVDLGSIRPFYDPERDEHPWQSEWPAAFETIERDARLLTAYDSDHDFSQGMTAAGASRPVDDPEAFLAAESARTYQGLGFLKRIAILLAGPLTNVVMAFALVVGSLTIAGVEVVSDTTVLGGVTEGSFAEAAGLAAGDTILRYGDRNVDTWVELCEAIDESLEEGGRIPVAYERDGNTYETFVELPTDGSATLIGITASMETYRPTIAQATEYAFSYIALVGSTVMRLIMPQHTIEVVSQSSSIVGISAMASDAAASGANDLILFAAAISLSLGFMNLLPIPPLDGGKILIELVQLAMRRPLSLKAQNAVSYVGLAFVLFIFCFALRNDVLRLMGLM